MQTGLQLSLVNNAMKGFSNKDKQTDLMPFNSCILLCCRLRPTIYCSETSISKNLLSPIVQLCTACTFISKQLSNHSRRLSRQRWACVVKNKHIQIPMVPNYTLERLHQFTLLCLLQKWVLLIFLFANLIGIKEHIVSINIFFIVRENILLILDWLSYFFQELRVLVFAHLSAGLSFLAIYKISSANRDINSIVLIANNSSQFSSLPLSVGSPLQEV